MHFGKLISCKIARWVPDNKELVYLRYAKGKEYKNGTVVRMNGKD